MLGKQREAEVRRVPRTAASTSSTMYLTLTVSAGMPPSSIDIVLAEHEV